MSENKCPVCEKLKEWLDGQVTISENIVSQNPFMDTTKHITESILYSYSRVVRNKMAELEKEEQKEKREIRKASWASVKGIFKSKECDSKEAKSKTENNE